MKGGEIAFIVFLVLYMIVVGMVANSMHDVFGFSAPGIGSLSSWQLPYVHTGVGWLTATVDFLEAILNLFAWLVYSLASFFVLIAFTISGNVPAWLTTIAFFPFGYALLWMVFSMVRGR